MLLSVEDLAGFIGVSFFLPLTFAEFLRRLHFLLAVHDTKGSMTTELVSSTVLSDLSDLESRFSFFMFHIT